MAGKTYESLFKQQTEVYVKYVASTYAVEHIMVGIVAIIVLTIVAISPMGGIFNLFGLLGPITRFGMPVVIGGGLAMLSALVDPGKKPLPLYLWGAVSYFFKPKVFVGGHHVMKRWKGTKTRVRQQITYTVSVGGIPLPAILIGDSGIVNLKAATEAVNLRKGIWIRKASSRGSRRATRLPYGRVTVTRERRGRIGYLR